MYVYHPSNLHPVLEFVESPAISMQESEALYVCNILPKPGATFRAVFFWQVAGSGVKWVKYFPFGSQVTDICSSL